MRPGRTQTGMNLYQYKIFAFLHETGTRCFLPGFGMRRYVFSNKYMADPKAYRLEISGPCLRISPLGPATETMSDRSQFIVGPASCKRIKRNVWEADTNSCRSKFVPLSCKYPLTSCTIDLSRPCTSRTVDFSLWLKHSDHEVTFFVGLRFRKYRSRDASFCCSPQREKRETILTESKTGRSYYE